MFFTFADIDFSEQLDYNCPGIKSNKHLASPPGGDYKEVRDFTVGTAHGTVRYKVKSGISFLV